MNITSAGMVGGRVRGVGPESISGHLQLLLRAAHTQMPVSNQRENEGSPTECAFAGLFLSEGYSCYYCSDSGSPLTFGFLSRNDWQELRRWCQGFLGTSLNPRVQLKSPAHNHTWDKDLPHFWCPLPFGETTWQWHSQGDDGGKRGETMTVQRLREEWQPWDFPGGPVTETPHSQCRGPGFDSWPGS